MRKQFGHLAAAMLAMFSCAFTLQRDKSRPPAPTPEAKLTEEDKEILKHRELLDNLELLQNLEKVKYLDFLSDKKIKKDKNQQGTKVPVKENAKKNN